MNYTWSWSKTYCIPLNLLLHYLVKFECSTVWLHIHTCIGQNNLQLFVNFGLKCQNNMYFWYLFDTLILSIQVFFWVLLRLPSFDASVIWYSATAPAKGFSQRWIGQCVIGASVDTVDTLRAQLKARVVARSRQFKNVLRDHYPQARRYKNPFYHLLLPIRTTVWSTYRPIDLIIQPYYQSDLSWSVIVI